MDLELNASVTLPTGRLSNPGTVYFDVASTNLPPLASDDQATTKAVTPVAIDVLANDVPDGGPIDPTSVVIVAAPSHGIAFVLPDGRIEYTPGPEYLGADSFSYTVRDLDGRVSNAATASVRVVASLLALVDDLYYVDEDDVLNVPAEFGVLSNDAADGGVFVVAAIAASANHGTVELAANGSFRYTPISNFFGDDLFRYSATDNHGASSEASVTIRVASSADAPVANDDAYTATAGTPLVVLAAPLTRQTLVPAGAEWKYLDDGTDQGTAWRGTTFDDSSWASGFAQFGYGDGDETTVVSYGDDFNFRYITTYFRREFFLDRRDDIVGVELGVLRDDGAIVHVNNQQVARSNISASANSVTLADRAVGDDVENEFVDVNVMNWPFVAGRNVIAVEIHQASRASNDMSFDLFLEIDRAGVRSGGVLANDSDPDTDLESLSASLVGFPVHGVISFSADGGFTYTPNAGFVGTDSFTYAARDDVSTSNVATVVINVVPFEFTPADLNEDAIVDVADVAIVVAGFGMVGGAGWNAGDVNGDGRVNLEDVMAVQRAIADYSATNSAAPAAIVAGNRDRREAAFDSRPVTQMSLTSLRAARRFAAHETPQGEGVALDARSVDRAFGRKVRVRA